MDPLVVAVLVVAGIVLLFAVFFCLQHLNLFIQGMFSGVPIPYTWFLRMGLARVDPKPVLYAQIRLCKSDIDVPLEATERFHREGQDLTDVVNAMIYAQRRGDTLTWDEATRRSRAGERLLDTLRAEDGDA